jgi:hypothetical protein
MHACLFSPMRSTRPTRRKMLEHIILFSYFVTTKFIWCYLIKTLFIKSLFAQELTVSKSFILCSLL